MDTTIPTLRGGRLAAFAAHALEELRRLKGAGVSPDALAPAVAGEDSPEAHAFRRELLAAGASANAIGRGLRGCDSPESHALRCEIAPETMGMRPLGGTLRPPVFRPGPGVHPDGHDPRNVLAWSLAGCGSEAAQEFRDILLSQGARKKCVAWSLAGCPQAWAFALRERLLRAEVDPAFVANGLRGCDAEDAWRLRERLLAQGVRRDWIVRGTAGCASATADALREKTAAPFPKDAALSLVGRDGARHHALRRDILAKDARHWPHVLLGLAGCDSDDAWRFRDDAIARAHPDEMARSLAGCASRRASMRRIEIRRAGAASPEALAASYLGDGEDLTWLWRLDAA